MPHTQNALLVLAIYSANLYSTPQRPENFKTNYSSEKKTSTGLKIVANVAIATGPALFGPRGPLC